MFKAILRTFFVWLAAIAVCIMPSALNAENEESYGGFKNIPKKDYVTEKFDETLAKVRINMTKSKLYDTFRNYGQKDYVKKGNEEWISFGEWMAGKSSNSVTFYLKDGKVKGWKRK